MANLVVSQTGHSVAFQDDVSEEFLNSGCPADNASQCDSFRNTLKAKVKAS
jgi:hypothetical protein